MKNNFDIAIIGTGPAGTSCALHLAESGLNIALIDKAIFPREKVCGDGLTNDTISQLKKFPFNTWKRFVEIEKKTSSNGLRITAPNGILLETHLSNGPERKTGYIIERRIFDNFLLSQVKTNSSITVIENCKVNTLKINNNEVIISTSSGDIKSRIIVGADGTSSVVARKLIPSIRKKIKKRHSFICLRGYFTNVAGIHPENFIEFHFISKILPGYFWLFPVDKDRVNAGIGMLASEVEKKHLSMHRIFNEIITAHPDISPRFSAAKLTGDIKGGVIPFGSGRRAISGERFLLLGDAASLADPITGEGIGNAIRSGRLAAQHILECFKNNDFSANFNRKYDALIYKCLMPEFKRSRWALTLARHEWLLNFIAARVKGNSAVKKMLYAQKFNMDLVKIICNPWFYIKLFSK